MEPLVYVLHKTVFNKTCYIQTIAKRCHELQYKCLFILLRKSAVIGVYVLVFYAVQGLSLKTQINISFQAQPLVQNKIK